MLVALLAIVVLGGAGYLAWHFTRPSKAPRVTTQQRCHPPTPSPAPMAAGQVRVKVLNTTKRDGLAASVRTVLRRRGFRVVGVGNAKPTVSGVVIRYPGAGTLNGAVVTLREEFPKAHLASGGRRGFYEVDLGRGFGRPVTEQRAREIRTSDERAAHPSTTCSPSA